MRSLSLACLRPTISDRNNNLIKIPADVGYWSDTAALVLNLVPRFGMAAFLLENPLLRENLKQDRTYAKTFSNSYSYPFPSLRDAARTETLREQEATSCLCVLRVSL